MFNLLRNYSYYDNHYGYYNDPFALSSIDSEVAGIAIIVSLVVAIIVYFTFLSKRNEGRFTGFTGWLYEVLNFGKLIIEALLKICYMFITLFISIISIIHMKDSFVEGLLVLIGFNLIIRIGYECLLMIVMLCKNTKEINSKLKDQNNNNNNNTMNGGRTNYNMPPQQSYGQTPYAQQPNSQPVMNRQPMGSQRPAGAQQPVGVQQPVGAQQPVASQQPVSAQRPMNNHYQGSTGPAVQPVNQDQWKPQVNSRQEELPKVQNVKYCQKCRNIVEHDDVFCPNCGTKVVE